MHRAAGDRFSVMINGNNDTVVIIAVRRPTKVEIFQVFPILREEA
jgi:hypothetical protein